jgi:sialic acid synthase SpsE
LRNSALRLDKIDISTYKIGCACVKRLEIANIVIYVLNSGYCSLITKFAYTEPFTALRLDKIDISTYKIGCACVKRLEIANIVWY